MEPAALHRVGFPILPNYSTIACGYTAPSRLSAGHRAARAAIARRTHDARHPCPT